MADSVLIVIKIPTVDEQALELNATSPPGPLVIATNKHGSKFIKSTLPVSFVPLKEKLEGVLHDVKAKDVTWQMTNNRTFWRVCFTCEMEETDSILELLASKSIGSYRDTYVGIIPFSFILKDDSSDDQQSQENDDVFLGPYLEGDKGFTNEGFAEDVTDAKGSCKRQSDFNSFQEKFLRSITARLTVAQVAASVKAGSDLTFDYIIYIIMASWISVMGLMENSIVSLVAAMLVSPLMNSVLAVTFGQVVQNKSIRNLGIKSSVVAFLLILGFGYFFGLIAFPFLDYWIGPDGKFPTDEMRSRGELRNLWVGLLVALPSGAAVSLSILSGVNNFLPAIGVAISASLLPPCANAGLLWAHATIELTHSYFQDASKSNTTSGRLPRMHHGKYDPVYDANDAVMECIWLGLVSICLSLVNIISMHISGILFLKIKEITPEIALSPSTARFFKQDLKIARQYNQEKSRGQIFEESSEKDVGQEILREWANATGLDSREIIFGNSAQSKAIQEQTLADMMADVQSDPVFQMVKKGSISMNPISPDLMQTFSPNVPQIVTPSTPFGCRRFTVIDKLSTAGSFTSSIDNSFNLSMIDKKSPENRRKSLALRQTLLKSDHLPYSVWPKARESRFQVTPVSLEVASSASQMTPNLAKYRRMSKTALNDYKEEIKKQSELNDETSTAESLG